jgi:hypothetical protein
VNRSGAYNPNDTLTGEYTGEKFYQTGPDALQRRWWINTVGTKWRLMTGQPFTGEWWGDGYLHPPVWVEYFDNSIWSPNMGSWDAGNQEWDSTGGQVLLFDILPWAVGFRPTGCRVTHNLGDIGKTCSVDVKSGDGAVSYGSANPYVSGEEIVLTCSDDIGRLYVSNETDGTDFSVSNIEFA